MHRIDGDAHQSNMFSGGDPGVPRLPTQITPEWLNDDQEEICNAIEGSGQTLVKGTQDQLSKAMGLNGGSGGARTFDTNGADPTMSLSNAGAGAALELGANTGSALDAANSGSTPAGKIQNIGGTGPALELAAPDGRWPLKLTPRTTIPTTNPAGGALSAADAGAVVYLGGALNKLYVFDGTTWNACW